MEADTSDPTGFGKVTFYTGKEDGTGLTEMTIGTDG